MPVLTLGIETSCDETACALVANGREVVVQHIASQTSLHAPYGGVVPELASRAHLDHMIPLVQKTLEDGKCCLESVDALCVTEGPGLMGSLLVGMYTAQGLAFSLRKPVIGVNHLHAHLYAPFMNQEIPLPSLGVLLSGGHSSLFFITNETEYQFITGTHDDALGEAFDKVARLLDLPYPGGPHIEHLAQQGDPLAYPFKGGIVKGHPYALSYSGLKTAVLYAKQKAQAIPEFTHETKCNLAASFQHAAFSDLYTKVVACVKEYCCHSIVFGGGVTQNTTLRRYFSTLSIPTFFAHPTLCGDNAAMIAGLGYHLYRKKKPSHPNPIHPYPTGALCYT